MQNQLSEVVSGTRKGVIVEPTLLSDIGTDIPLNKFKHKEFAYLGMNLKVLKNVPNGYKLNVLVMDSKTNAPKYILFDYDNSQPFGTFVLHEDVDCMIVSGRFKPSHSCRKL